MIQTYQVWQPDRDETRDDARTIKAHDPQAAAEEWARRDDRSGAEYRIVEGNDVVVAVAHDGSDEYSTYYVHGETVASYTAREVRSKDLAGR